MMQSGKSSAVVEAASAIHDKFQMYYGQSVDEETVFTAMAEAAYPIIAEAVARATADAIADKIEAEAGHSCGSYEKPGTAARALSERRGWGIHYPEHYEPFCDGCGSAESADRAVKSMAAIARSHGRTPETDTTEATE